MLRRLFRPLAIGLRSLLGTNGLAAGLAELQLSVNAAFSATSALEKIPPPSEDALPRSIMAWPVVLPPDTRLLRIAAKDARRPGFDLVLPEIPGGYDQIQIDTRHYSDVAYLLTLDLGGTGTLVDLGANIGTVALPVAASGSHVVAVEMLPSNYLRLLLAAIVNQLPHLLPVNAAASSYDGTICFAGSEAWASIVVSDAKEAVALRLDTILGSIARHNPTFLRAPFALKIDVEGHEYSALIGAERFLAEYRPTIIFESIELEQALANTSGCKKLLAAAGYRLFMLRDQMLIPKEPEDVQEELVGDFLAMPRERVALMPERFVGFEIRQPTVAERLRWLETLLHDTVDHQKHALKVIDLIGREDAVFANSSAKLRTELEKAVGSIPEPQAVRT